MLLFFIILICCAFVFTLFFQGIEAIAAIGYYVIKGIIKLCKFYPNYYANKKAIKQSKEKR